MLQQNRHYEKSESGYDRSNIMQPPSAASLTKGDGVSARSVSPFRKKRATPRKH